MPRYALKLEYDGGPFAGWQAQTGQPSIQGTLERALARLDAATHAGLCRVLARPLDIRGYGPVKEEAARRVRAEVEAELPG